MIEEPAGPGYETEPDSIRKKTLGPLFEKR